jgi:prepilin-type N-terminal cleavage/methylation domain-containing protein
MHNRSPESGRRCTGFTLVELIAAIVVISIAIPPMLIALRSAHTNRVDPVLASRARWLATEKLEDIIADRHSTTRGYAYLDETNYPDEDAGDIPAFPGFARRVSLTETAADLVTPGTGYMTAIVTVEWTDARAQNRQATISTVLTEYTP